MDEHFLKQLLVQLENMQEPHKIAISLIATIPEFEKVQTTTTLENFKQLKLVIWGIYALKQKHTIHKQKSLLLPQQHLREWFDTTASVQYFRKPWGKATHPFILIINVQHNLSIPSVMNSPFDLIKLHVVFDGYPLDFTSVSRETQIQTGNPLLLCRSYKNVYRDNETGEIAIWTKSSLEQNWTRRIQRSFSYRPPLKTLNDGFKWIADEINNYSRFG